jgi:hypothetical protein
MKKKLQFKSETIRTLSDANLAGVVGGSDSGGSGRLPTTCSKSVSGCSTVFDTNCINNVSVQYCPGSGNGSSKFSSC